MCAPAICQKTFTARSRLCPGGRGQISAPVPVLRLLPHTGSHSRAQASLKLLTPLWPPRARHFLLCPPCPALGLSHFSFSHKTTVPLCNGCHKNQNMVCPKLCAPDVYVPGGCLPLFGVLGDSVCQSGMPSDLPGGLPGDRRAHTSSTGPGLLTEFWSLLHLHFEQLRLPPRLCPVAEGCASRASVPTATLHLLRPASRGQKGTSARLWPASSGWGEDSPGRGGQRSPSVCSRGVTGCYLGGLQAPALVGRNPQAAGCQFMSAPPSSECSLCQSPAASP